MTEKTDPLTKYRKIGTAGFICDIIALLLSTAAYIFSYLMVRVYTIIPEIPALQYTIIIAAAIFLILGLILETISLTHNAQRKWQTIIGIIIWIIAAFITLSMIRLFFF